MTIPLGAQIAVTCAGLAVYVFIAVMYERRWDTRFRAALSKKVGADVQWGKVSGRDTFGDDGDAPSNAWRVDGSGSLGRQVWQTAVVRSGQIAVMVVLGCLPPLALLGVEFLLKFNGLLIGATAFAIIPVFALSFGRSYNR